MSTLDLDKSLAASLDGLAGWTTAPPLLQWIRPTLESSLPASSLQDLPFDDLMLRLRR